MRQQVPEHIQYMNNAPKRTTKHLDWKIKTEWDTKICYLHLLKSDSGSFVSLCCCLLLFLKKGCPNAVVFNFYKSFGIKSKIIPFCWPWYIKQILWSHLLPLTPFAKNLSLHKETTNQSIWGWVNHFSWAAPPCLSNFRESSKSFMNTLVEKRLPMMR